MAHLVKRYSIYDRTHVADMIACLAANIEDAYLTAGVHPSKFTAKECVDRAMDALLPAYAGSLDLKKLDMTLNTKHDGLPAS